MLLERVFANQGLNLRLTSELTRDDGTGPKRYTKMSAKEHFNVTIFENVHYQSDKQREVAFLLTKNVKFITKILNITVYILQRISNIELKLALSHAEILSSLINYQNKLRY